MDYSTLNFGLSADLQAEFESCGAVDIADSTAEPALAEARRITFAIVIHGRPDLGYAGVMTPPGTACSIGIVDFKRATDPELLRFIVESPDDAVAVCFISADGERHAWFRHRFALMEMPESLLMKRFVDGSPHFVENWNDCHAYAAMRLAIGHAWLHGIVVTISEHRGLTDAEVDALIPAPTEVLEQVGSGCGHHHYAIGMYFPRAKAEQVAELRHLVQKLQEYMLPVLFLHDGDMHDAQTDVLGFPADEAGKNRWLAQWN